MDAITATPVADQLAKARADLAQATTAAKLATAKRAQLAAEVRAFEAEAVLEDVRLQARTNRQRADAAEARADAADAALATERAAHLAEEREHAAEVGRLKGQPTKRAAARKATSGATGYATTATPHGSAAARMAMLPTAESADPSGPAEQDPISDRPEADDAPRP